MAKKGESGKEEFFQKLDADVGEVTEIESLCVNCMEQGVTKLLLTSIPFYKEVIIASFECGHCDFKNSELSSAMEIAAQGIEFRLSVDDKEDLNRMVVKSEYAHVFVPELELEIPVKSQKGEVTTVEGVIDRVRRGLEQDQERRKDESVDVYKQIEDYLQKIRDCLGLKEKFNMVIRDATGNSFIGPRPLVLSTESDPHLKSKHFNRTSEEDKLVGLEEQRPQLGSVTEEDEEKESADDKGITNFKHEVLEMDTNCPECGVGCKTKMKVTDIPFFKEVIIMATDCDKCGHRTNEVKSGTGVEPKGKRISLKVKSKDDLSRDVLKSDTCMVKIPEVDLEAGSGAIVGKFTTVEGLLVDIKKQFSEENPFVGSDSLDPTMKTKLEDLRSKLDVFLTGATEFTLILDDPAGNSYIQNIYAPDEDPEMETASYERDFEQNEELGLNDMVV